MNDAELLEKLQAAFRSEADERLASLTSGLLELEKDPEGERRSAVLEVIFREAHSLKGASRAVNMIDVETLCQSMENVFGALKRGEIDPSPPLFDTLHEAVAATETILGGSGGGPASTFQDLVEPLASRLDAFASGAAGGAKQFPAPAEGETGGAPVAPEPASDSPAPAEGETGGAPVAPGPASDSPAPAASPDRAPAAIAPGPDPSSAGISPPRSAAARKPASFETVRIASAKLDSLLLKAEELVSLKPMAENLLEELRGVMSLFAAWKEKRASVDGTAGILRRRTAGAPVPGGKEGLFSRGAGSSGAGNAASSAAAGILEFLDWSRDHLERLGEEVAKAVATAVENRYFLGRMVDDLLDDMKKVTMLPCAALFETYPRMVREICRDRGKEADLEIQGGGIEIDKRILEELRDPLVHLLRNAVDHGLEMPEEREKLGKPWRGALLLAASQTAGDKVEILVKDDGRGIDAERIREEAVDRGIIERAEASHLTGGEALSMIFLSGLSTSRKVDKISGRGLGMAIVREKIEALGGSLVIESRPGEGTCFRIRLPVTLATFHGLLVRVRDETFVVPGIHVDRVARIEREAVRIVGGRETVLVAGRTVTLVDLGDLLEFPPGAEPRSGRESITALVLGSGSGRIAFEVDEILGEREVLVKGLGRQLARVRNVAGAAVIGSGRPVLVLNVSDLMKSAERAASGTRPIADDEEAGKKEKKKILVAEDSITSRMLLKGILEEAGYEVKTAVDGAAALAALERDRFDLVVSDVEMPRMTGFELTSAIRARGALSGIPVILVTALKSAADRERGFDAGANAYITKGSFDQSNLLDTVRRLV